MNASPSRRDLLLGSLASAAALGAGPVQAQALPVPSLAEIAAKNGLQFGSCIGREQDLPADYAQLYLRHAKVFATENASKFDFIRPTQDRFEFDGLDRIVEFGLRNNKLIEATALIWNDYPPAWLKRRPGREIERIFDEHLDRLVERYVGRVQTWEVVNEPFFPMSGQKGGYRNGPWFAAMGPSYISRAYKRVRAIDKTATLSLNEAFCESDYEWGVQIRPLFKGLVERLQDEGVPLDAIGFQAHLKPQWPYSDATFARYLDGFAGRKLDIFLTELDVDDAAFSADIVQRDLAVAARYRDFLGAVLPNPAVKRVVTWQLSDRDSWLKSDGSKRPHVPRPLPFDDALRPKAAYFAIAEAFGRRRLPSP